MDVCFLLTLYLAVVEGAGWICGKVCVGRNGREVRWLPPKVFISLVLWYTYGVLKRGTENVRIR